MAACDSVVRLLSPYLDDELSAPDRAAVEAHLRECAKCPERLADLKATQAAMSAYFTAQAEAADFSGFSAKVMHQIRKEPMGLGQRTRLWWAETMAYHSTAIYSGMGAAMAAAAAVVLLVGRPVAPDNSLVVHGMSVSDPAYEPVVMHTDDGESVIMLVEHQAESDEPGSPSAAPQQEPPHGGSL
jgi:anti-sigma factor RsiW